ncbi:MAG: S9 family peptidase [Candidatus Dormiibacterota bacterium]
MSTGRHARRLVIPSDLYDIRYVSDSQISPDGSHIAFVRTDVVREIDSYISTICTVDRRGDGLQEIGEGRLPRFSPSGMSVAFARGAELWIMDSDLHLVAQMPGTVRELKWQPQGQQLAAVVDTTTDARALSSVVGVHHIVRPRYLSDGEGFTYNHRPQVVVVDVRSGEVRPVTHEQHGAFGVAWSPDGRRLAYIRPLGDPDVGWNREICTQRVGALESTSWWRGVGIQNLEWAPSGERIAFRAGRHRYQPSMNFDLWAMTLGVPAQILTESLDRFVGNDRTLGDAYWGFQSVVQGGLWTRAGESLVFIAADRGTNRLYEVFTEPGDLRPIPMPDDAVVFDFQVASDTTDIVATVATSSSATEIWLLPGGGPITTVNERVAARVRIEVPHRITWQSSEGPEVEGWVYSPDVAPGIKPPVILFVHGGPYRQHSVALAHEVQAMVSHGYTVFCPNPRGSQGYGEAFAAAIDDDWGNYDYKDLIAGLDYVLAAGYGDAERVGVVGGSYGGYMVNWIVTHTQRFKAAVSDRSISDLTSYLGTADGALTFGRPLFGSPWQESNLESLRRQSPIAYVADAHTPTLLMHGLEDEVCPIDQSRQFYLALWESGCEVEMVLFPNSSHDLPRRGRPSLRERRIEWILAWFDNYL